MSALTGLQWYAIHTKPRQEATAELHLKRQGFEVYLPRVAELKRRQGQLTSSTTAYFPRYLFVRFDADCDNWAPIRSTRGVSALVKVLGRPRAVPEELVTLLKSNEDSEQLQRVCEKTWKRGEQVKIEAGPFAGYECIFQEQRSAGRVAVLLSLIGKPTLATLKRQDLQVPQYA